MGRTKRTLLRLAWDSNSLITSGGPAAWLRCVKDLPLEGGKIPVRSVVNDEGHQSSQSIFTGGRFMMVEYLDTASTEMNVIFSFKRILFHWSAKVAMTFRVL